MAGIYIHIPFCAQFCTYCNFYSVKNTRSKTQFITSLLNECELRINKKNFKGDSTLYIGGGTPSTFKTSQISQIINKVKELSGATFNEITMEVNPDDVSFKFATELIDAGVNRISMGIQSLNDNHLKWMNRRHSAIEGEEAYYTLKNAGFNNISLDLIFGYTGLSSVDWEKDIAKIIELSPQHISAYQMSIEPGSKLWKDHEQGRYLLPSDDICIAQYNYMQNTLESAGYKQYEVSSFCKEGYESKHNSSYWNGTPYIGLGPGAHSFNGDNIRSYNSENLTKYIANFSGSPSINFSEKEELTDIDIFNEAIMLGLRTVKGINITHLPTNLIKKIEHQIISQIQMGNLIKQGNILFIPKDKLFISDTIIRELFLI